VSIVGYISKLYLFRFVLLALCPPMPSPETLAAFFATSVLLCLTPGPDNLFVLLHSARHGWRAGICVVLGLCLGLVGHTTAVALGLAAVFAASALAFAVLKYCGAVWLLWLAWNAWHTSASKPEAAQQVSAETVIPARKDALRMVGRGLLMNVTNPKVLLFFLALLPQFVDTARGGMGQQIMLLGLLFILATVLVFGAIARFSGAFGALLLRSMRARLWLDRIAALVFVGLAVRLATSSR